MVGLNDLALRTNATGNKFSAGSADQIMIWDAGGQTYVNLALYDNGTTKSWKPVKGFPTSTATNPVFKPGQGFWFRAVSNDFLWVEPNGYKAGLD